MTKTEVKICGLSTPETLQAAVDAGARFVGFVFYPPSPRNVNLDTAYELARSVPTGVRTVGLFVDPDNALLDQIVTGVQLDMIQLHGNETPDRVKEIKERYGAQVMKAIRVGSDRDLEGVEAYESVVDWLMFDAKPDGANLPGGMGERFDWNILAGRDFKKPWMLAGGLDADTVQEALAILKPDAVDVSSGVESARGVKDIEKIKAFIEAVKDYEQA